MSRLRSAIELFRVLRKSNPMAGKIKVLKTKETPTGKVYRQHHYILPPTPGSKDIQPPDEDVVGRVSLDIAARHNENGGSSTHVKHGDMVGRDVHAVSLFPDLSHAVGGPNVTADHVADYMREHHKVLHMKGAMLGTYYSPKSGQSYLDVSTGIKDHGLAVQVGREHNQESIIHLGTFEETPTGGDGKIPPHLKNVRTRLIRMAQVSDID